MEPEAPFRGQVFTVTAITMAIKQMMEGVFRGVFVEGEVGQLREAASGHLYFNLKDREALLAAVMFKWDARKNGLDLQEGMQVRVFGDLSCYAKQGKYQIVVKNVEALHKGNLFLEFEKLKKKLQTEGLFDESHKRPIPAFPTRIGVVTSPTGAAIRDILSVLRRRSPNLEVVLAPALVQGEEAAGQIAQAIADLNRLKPAPDVLLVAQKGKSQDVKQLVNKLKKEKRKEVDENRTMYRPWGSYTILAEGEGYKVKRITINPGAKLSLQLHYHRSEHWTVISGTGKLTLDDKEVFFRENESTYIPIGVRHRLENPGKLPLSIIEVQNGKYLGEDDIVRFDDVYGRDEE